MKKRSRNLALFIVLVSILSSFLSFNTITAYATQKISVVTTTQDNVSAQFKGKPTSPKDTSAPLKPTGLAAMPENQAIALSWNANTEIDLANYQLEYKKSDSRWVKVILPKTVTSYTQTGLINGIMYQFRIKAKDISGNWSQYSDMAYATPSATIPQVPNITNLAFSNIGGIPYLSWTNPETNEIAALEFQLSLDGVTWNSVGSMEFNQSITQRGMSDIIYDLESITGDANLKYSVRVVSIPASASGKSESIAYCEGKFIVNIQGEAPIPSIAAYNGNSWCIAGLKPDQLYNYCVHFWDNDYTHSGGIGSRSNGEFVGEIPANADQQTDIFRWNIILREIYGLEQQGNDIIWSMSQITKQNFNTSVASVFNLTFSSIDGMPFLNWTNPVTDEISTLEFQWSSDGVTWDTIGNMQFDLNNTQWNMSNTTFWLENIMGEANLSYYIRIKSIPKIECNKSENYAVSNGKFIVNIQGIAPVPSYVKYNSNSWSIGGLKPDQLYNICAHFWNNDYTHSGGIMSSNTGIFVNEIPSTAEQQSDIFRWSVIIREIYRLDIQGNDIIWSLSPITKMNLVLESL